MTTPKHGEVRNHHMETRHAPAEVWETTDEHSVSVIPSSRTETVCDKFCARCGWIPVRGVVGALTWLALHDSHNNNNN